MGQRHQAFIIACIGGKRYRTLAVIHNQWLFSIAAVRQCLLTMRILSAAGNLPGIRRELRLAESKPDNFWPLGSRMEKDRSIDFPFLTTCLLLGSGLRPEGNHAFPSHDCPIDVPYDGGDNNDGISIFDVTEPSSPRYAMLFPPDADASLDEDEEDLEDTILTASGYMRRYQHGEAAINLDDHPQVHALDSLPLLHIESLKSAWPHGNFQERVGIQFNTSKIVDDHNHAGEDAAVAKPATSLRKSALDTVIKRAFDSDGVSWLEDAEQLQGFTEHLRAYLYAHPDAIDHTTSCSLLERAFRECTEIDLSPFCGLVSNQVLGIVAAVSSSKVNLVLPDLETFGIEDLRKLLANNCIAELRIGKHQIDDLSDILSAIDGTSVTRLIIPEMYSRRFVKLGDFREDIRPVPGGGLYCKQWKSPLTRLPRPKQFPIVQMLHIISSDEESAASVHHSPWSRLINQEDPRSHNTGVRLVSLPMSEYLLSATNGVRALSGFLNGFTARFPSLISFEVGRDIMSTMERLSLRDDLTVDPLPGDLTAFIKRMCASSPAPDAPSRQLAIGEWTIVTCYEPEFKDPSVPPKLRYGFATLNAENRTIVVGTAEFLRMHTPEGEAADTDANVSRWERSMDSLTQKVLNDRRDDFQTSSRRQRIGAGLFARGGDPELEEISGLKTGVFRAHEVDEIFEALANMGRLVSPPL